MHHTKVYAICCIMLHNHISYCNFKVLFADDTPLMAENVQELKSLLMKVKDESEKADLKHNIQ